MILVFDFSVAQDTANHSFLLESLSVFVYSLVFLLTTRQSFSMSFDGSALFPLPLNSQMPHRAQLPYSLYALSGPLVVNQAAQEAP